MVSPLDLLELREKAEQSRKESSEFALALDDIQKLGEKRVSLSER
jgi:hypothetical protein